VENTFIYQREKGGFDGISDNARLKKGQIASVSKEKWLKDLTLPN